MKRLLFCLIIACLWGNIAISATTIPHIMAYDLRVAQSGNDYTFTFFANTQPISGKLLFHTISGESLGEYTIPQPLQSGDNTITIPASALPSSHTTIAWSLQLSAASNPQFGIIYEGEVCTRAYAAINNHPESDYFGYIYLANRKGVGLCHIYAFDYAYQPTFATGNDYITFNSTGRPAIDSEGYIYWPDWGDLKSGITIMNPVDYSEKQFFSGIQNDDNGVWYNSVTNTDLGSSCSGVSIYGSGKNTKLYAMNEDIGEYSQLTKKGFVIYQIGNEDGTISRQWKTAPTQVIAVEDNNTNGNFAIVACSHGAWLCQHTLTNQAGTYALMFYDHQGKRQYASTDATLISGSNGAGIALNREENQLAMVNADGNILIFDITWQGDTPTLSLRTTYTTTFSAIGSIHFDYAGNLITTSGNNFGGSKDDLRLVIYSTPTDSNTIVVPARTSQHIQRSGTGTSHFQLLFPDESTPTKILRNGHLYILHHGQIYTILGF